MATPAPNLRRLPQLVYLQAEAVDVIVAALDRRGAMGRIKNAVLVSAFFLVAAEAFLGSPEMKRSEVLCEFVNFSR
eukprot:5003250-Lingulodinium_polyedra.AAC.1